MKNMRDNNRQQKASRSEAAAFKKANEEMNIYYEEFQACKKSWTKGALFGVLTGIVSGLLFSGFALNDVFFGMGAITAVSATWLLATIFGLQNTEDFGCSCISLGIIRFGTAIVEIFVGTYVLAWVALLLSGIILGAWAIGVFLFAALFPIETIYYWIRYSIEKQQVRNYLRTRKTAMA